MAFNTLEYLRDGKVDFVFRSTPYDYKRLIENVRKAPNRIEIINGFLSKLKEELPYFCFEIIYDIPEFATDAYELLDIKIINPSMLRSILNNSTYGDQLLEEHLEFFLKNIEKEEYLKVICEYAFQTKGKILHKLSRYPDLHIRFLFMSYLITNHPEQIDTIYDDITKYTTSVTYEPYEQLTFLPQLMNPDDISKLAVLLLTNNRPKDYKTLKEFILKEYKYNYLASELLARRSFKEDPSEKQKEKAFSEDADDLFTTSMDFKYAIYLGHKYRVSKELLEQFANRIKYYLGEGKDLELGNVYRNGLGTKLEEWTEKYLELSKSKEYEFIGEGTTCTCFRIGDYVIKLVNTKWSYEDVICPNIYLIAKNYEEVYLRDDKGIVKAGLEVQKYLTRKAENIDPKYFRYFDLALDRLGYKRTDSLTKGVCGENTMLLDTYRDADCPNPERVPVWFKQYPLVLVDRDRIYKKDQVYIKQLRSGY